MKRKMKHKKILTIACALVLLIALAACRQGANNVSTQSAQNQTADTPFMQFEGEAIYGNDLRFVAAIMGLTLDTEAEKITALGQLIEFLAIIRHANALGLGITPQEHEEMLPTAVINVDVMGLSDFLTNQRLVEFFAVGTLLTRLLDHYVANFVPDITAYAGEVAAFGEENRHFLADINLQYIVTQDFDLALNLRDTLIAQGASNLGELAAQHSVFYDHDGGAIVYPLHTFLQIFGLYDHDIAALYNLQSGDISHVFNVEDFFFIVYIQSRTEATQARIEEAFIQNYNFQRRAELIDGLVETWIAEASYTIDQEAFDALR